MSPCAYAIVDYFVPVEDTYWIGFRKAVRRDADNAFVRVHVCGCCGCELGIVDSRDTIARRAALFYFFDGNGAAGEVETVHERFRHGKSRAQQSRQHNP